MVSRRPAGNSRAVMARAGIGEWTPMPHSIPIRARSCAWAIGRHGRGEEGGHVVSRVRVGADLLLPAEAVPVSSEMSETPVLTQMKEDGDTCVAVSRTPISAAIETWPADRRATPHARGSHS